MTPSEATYETVSHFTSLRCEWVTVFEAGSKAEAAAHADPCAACFYGRRALELALSCAFKHGPELRVSYQDNFATLMHEPSFKQTVGKAVFNKAGVIITLDDRTVHCRRLFPTGASQCR